MTTPQDDLLDGELIASIADGTCVLFLGAGFTSAFSSVGGENVKTASELGESIVKSLIERRELPRPCARHRRDHEPDRGRQADLSIATRVPILHL